MPMYKPMVSPKLESVCSSVLPSQKGCNRTGKLSNKGYKDDQKYGMTSVGGMTQ